MCYSRCPSGVLFMNKKCSPPLNVCNIFLFQNYGKSKQFDIVTKAIQTVLRLNLYRCISCKNEGKSSKNGADIGFEAVKSEHRGYITSFCFICILEKNDLYPEPHRQRFIGFSTGSPKVTCS